MMTLKRDLAHLADDFKKRREEVAKQIESTEASNAISKLREEIEALRARLTKTAIPQK